MPNESTLDLCNQATHRFFHRLDERRYVDMLDMMLPDAIWLRQGRRLCGHAQIMEALEARSPTMRVRHVMSNGFVESESADSAHYIAYMVGYRYDDGVVRQPPLTINGPARMLLVDTQFVRRNGAWLIRETHVVPEFEFSPATA